MKGLVVIFACLLVLCGVFARQALDPVAEHERFLALAIERGDEAPPELQFDVALTALRAVRPLAAEIAAERMAVRGGPEWYARRDFLLGNAAWLRGERSELLSDRPEGGMPELDAAIAETRAAGLHWRSAYRRDAGLEAARRNAERASRRLTALRAKRDELEGKSAREKDGEDATSEENVPAGDPELGDEETPGAADEMLTDAPGDSALDDPTRPMQTELSPKQVVDLESKLDAKRAEKRRMRRDALRSRARGGADW